MILLLLFTVNCQHFLLLGFRLMINSRNFVQGLACIASLVVVHAQAAPPEFLCSGKNDNSPVFVHRDSDGSLQRLIDATQRSGSYKIKYSEIPAVEIEAMCTSGANRTQGSVYYTKASSSGTWITTPAIDSSSPYLRTGNAGTVFFVASGGPTGVWSLNFTNVSSVTQP